MIKDYLYLYRDYIRLYRDNYLNNITNTRKTWNALPSSELDIKKIGKTYIFASL